MHFRNKSFILFTVYAYEQGFGMGPEAQQLQLQMNAMDRPTSRLSGILADGGAT